MFFSLSALWWRRIRCLWKLPDGREWLRGKLGLVLVDRAMLSKSLIQFSVDGCGCAPSLLFDLRPNYGGGNEDVWCAAVHSWSYKELDRTEQLNWTELNENNGDLLQKKIGLKFFWAWSLLSEQDLVFPSVSLFHQEASISLLSFSIWGQTDWKTQSQKTNQSNHMYHGLANEIKSHAG